MSKKAFIIILSVLAVLFLFTVVLGLIYIDNDTNKRINLILTAIGSFATILTLAFALIPKSKFSGAVHCWNTKENVFVAEGDTHLEYKKITFRILNTGKNSLSNVKINFKLPLNVVHYSHYTREQGVNTRVIKDSLFTYLSDSIILGTSYGDNEYLVEYYIAFTRWNKGNIYLTISADQIETTTYNFSLKYKQKLIDSDVSNYFKLN